MKMKHFYSVLCAILLAGCIGKNTVPSEEKNYVINSSVDHPEWTTDAVIYEVNIRQYTPEGTFRAFIDHIPRLQDLGVDILWLMPVHPIGKVERKGSLGSYYSVQDYFGINPEFGTMKDFRDLVVEAHAYNMYVIIDWVANHTSWDNPWVKQHPEWYKTDSTGNMLSPFDWTDVVQLNYEDTALQVEMLKAMKFWVETADIDGYRCDVAGMVPCDFWEVAREELDKIKPVFMLAENEDKSCLVEEAFDMNYAWELHHIMNEIAKDSMTAENLYDYFERMDSIYDPDIYRMNFITNHDENSWNGTEFERLGAAVGVFAMLTFTLPGMPLLYSGQEIGFDERLIFFEKDTIEWIEEEIWSRFYKDMINLKTENPVFWNGTEGGSFKTLKVESSDNIFAFERSRDDELYIVIANLGGDKESVKMNDYSKSLFSDILTGDDYGFDKSLKLKPYEYLILRENY